MPYWNYWRVGQKVKLNVYEGERPICQCHTEGDAYAIVNAVNEWMHRIYEKGEVRRISVMQYENLSHASLVELCRQKDSELAALKAGKVPVAEESKPFVEPARIVHADARLKKEGKL